MTNEVSADISIESPEGRSTRVPFSLSSWFTVLIVRTIVLTLARDPRQIAYNRISLNCREENDTVKLSRTRKMLPRIDMYDIIALNDSLHVAIGDRSGELCVNRR